MLYSEHVNTKITFADVGLLFEFHGGLVLMPIAMSKAMKMPEAKAANN